MHNNSTRISVAERSHYSHYGTQSLRLSKDSQHQFDQCGICLHILVEPMAWCVENIHFAFFEFLGRF